MIIRSFIRVNHKIRVPSVRCTDSKGETLGIMSTKDAMKHAEAEGLDLVEISPNANPPVCRIMDFGKFRYEEGMKKKASRRQSRAHSRALKEIKFHVNVAEHDYMTKVNHVRKFLEKGHKVKVSLQFRGRENAHRDLGFELMERVIKDCDEVSNVEQKPKMLGRTIVAMLSCASSKK